MCERDVVREEHQLVVERAHAELLEAGEALVVRVDARLVGADGLEVYGEHGSSQHCMLMPDGPCEV